jgi:hypothetical protein
MPRAHRSWFLLLGLAVSLGCGRKATPPSAQTCEPGTFGAACAPCTCVNGGSCDDGAGGTGACTCLPGWSGASCAEPPALGVYRVQTDGSGLRLLVDAGTRELSHVRRQAGSDWLAAVRYNGDPDGNGLAMENEEGFGAYYLGTEIVVFPLTAPTSVHVVAGSAAGGMAANASWTDDGKLVFVRQPSGGDAASIHIARATFTAVPQVASVDPIPLPAQLLAPVDPHQRGRSDATGKLVVSATFQLAPGNLWMRPLWQLPASGDPTFAATSVVGCPICQAQGGCCGWTDVADVLGTNDARIDHAGARVMWMQQSPNVPATVGGLTFYPYRQVMRTLAEPGQVELTPPGTAETTSLTFGEWRADDAELVYWAIELDGAVIRNNLYVMRPDGSARTRIPLPRELCPLHPTYLSPAEIVFNAWRCVGPQCSCDVPRP